ncbi:MAG: HTH domain-containing protein [Candidatus Heimdallarchaeota archaeon]|nr:HTH domain-containing protein [Candidatus Heimdallarchaeota archaeon]
MSSGIQEDSKELDRLQERASNLLEDLMHEFNENPMLGRLFTVFIFGHDTIFKQGDLAEKLNVTVSTISRNLKTLEDWGVIKRTLVRTPKKGTSKDKYEYSEKKDSVYSFISILDKNYTENAEMISEMHEALKRLKGEYDSLPEGIKSSKKGKNISQVLEPLLIYFDIIEEEYYSFIERLQERFKKEGQG